MSTLFLADFEKSSRLQVIYPREFKPIGAGNDGKWVPEPVFGAFYAHIVNVLSNQSSALGCSLALLGELLPETKEQPTAKKLIGARNKHDTISLIVIT